MDVVLNWLVQGVILALGAAAVLRVIPSSRTQARYGLVCAAYLSLLLLPILSMAPALPRVEAASGSTPFVTMPVVWWTSATVAGVLWMVWFGVQAAALGRGVVAVHGAKRRALAFPRDLLVRLPHWSAVGATGRPTCLVLSDRIRGAGVLGCGTPVIAIAPRLLDELSPGDLDRVIVHEWAHVQRRDDLAQLAQRLARAFVGWHPAAWWLERQLEFEREVACDEIAVRVTGSAKRYAECLVTIAALPRRPLRPVPVLSVVSRSRLHRRITRIVAADYTAGMRPSRALEVSAVVALLACALAVGHVEVVTFGVPSAAVTAAERARDLVLAVPPTLAAVEPGASGSRSTQASNRRSQAPVRALARNNTARRAATMHAVDELSTPPIVSLTVASFEQLPTATVSVREPVSLEPFAGAVGAAPEGKAPTTDAPGPWGRAADAGVAIGRASQGAGVRTAGFFRRFGKSVAGSF